MAGGHPVEPVRGGEPDAVKNLSKVLDILEHLGAGQRAVSGSDIARATGFNVSTAFRQLQTLVSRGYVEQDPGHLSYVLGPRFTSLRAPISRARTLPRSPGRTSRRCAMLSARPLTS